MRRPTLAGKPETLLNQIDRYDRKGTGKPSERDDKLPYDANTEDGH